MEHGNCWYEDGFCRYCGKPRHWRKLRCSIAAYMLRLQKPTPKTSLNDKVKAVCAAIGNDGTCGTEYPNMVVCRDAAGKAVGFGTTHLRALENAYKRMKL